MGTCQGCRVRQGALGTGASGAVQGQCCACAAASPPRPGRMAEFAHAPLKAGHVHFMFSSACPPPHAAGAAVFGQVRSWSHDRRARPAGRRRAAAGRAPAPGRVRREIGSILAPDWLRMAPLGPHGRPPGSREPRKWRGSAILGEIRKISGALAPAPPPCGKNRPEQRGTRQNSGKERKTGRNREKQAANRRE